MVALRLIRSAAVAALLGEASSHATYMSAVPNGMVVERNGVSWFGVGHQDSMGGGELNPFGEAFKAAGFSWTAELCSLDSDGDGQTNGMELGDPDCIWSSGQSASRTSDISHPGFVDSKSTAGELAATTTTKIEVTSTTETEPPTTATASTTAMATSATTTTVTTTATSSTATATGTSTETSTNTPTETSTTATTTTPAPASTTTVSAPTDPATTTVVVETTTAEEPTTTLSATTPEAEVASTTSELAGGGGTEAPGTAGTNESDVGDNRSQAGGCQFEVQPANPGFFWDESCIMGDLGCFADGKNVACRFCGGLGDYHQVPCPPTSCQFANEPFVPYFWDESCEEGMLGCWADGIHGECRFCGDMPYTSITCPDGRAGQERPTAPPPAVGSVTSDSRCSFPNEPAMPYYWDDSCYMGMLGCMADGIHAECRFCAQRPFESISCPAAVAPPPTRCYFPDGLEPTELYYWDATCQLGMLGCWADNIHPECRFCGGITYQNVSCPTTLVKSAEEAAAASSERSSSAVSQVKSSRGQLAAQDIEDENDDVLVEVAAALPAAQLPGIAAAFVGVGVTILASWPRSA